MHRIAMQLHTAATRAVLKRVGNMSSGTVYFVLDELRERRTDKEFAIMCSFGPGLTTEGNLLRICPRVGSSGPRIVQQPSLVAPKPTSNPYILGVGTANPVHTAKPDAVCEKMIEYFGSKMTEKDAKRLRRIAKTSGIDQRHVSISLEVS